MHLSIAVRIILQARTLNHASVCDLLKLTGSFGDLATFQLNLVNDNHIVN